MNVPELVGFVEDSLKSSSKMEVSASLNKMGVSPGEIENIFSLVRRRRMLLIGGIVVFVFSLVLTILLSYYFFF